MRTKVLLLMMLSLCAMGSANQARATLLITNVDRINGTAGNRSPIGAFNSETDPLPSEGGLANGLYCFSDRAYTWSNMVPEMAGQEYVRTFNTDKGDNGDVTYRVTISGPGTFWITMDDRFGSQQSMVDQTVADFASAGTFADTGCDLFIGGDNDRRMSVFKSSETSPAGTYDFRYSANGNNYYTIGIDAPAGNQPPDVDAGNNAEITMPAQTVILDGTVTDDGLGTPEGYLAVQWSKLSGPGEVEFAPNATMEDPTVTFEMHKYGAYVLQLYATDGEYDHSDTVTVTVHEPNCPVGDMNGDCIVDDQDYCLFAMQWLTSPGGDADFSGDDYVDFSDYKWIAGNWLLNNQTGSLQVTLYPEDVRGIGAYWRVNGGLWRDSGDIQDGLAIGTGTVEFSWLEDWYKPVDQEVEIVYGSLNQAGGTYVQHTGSLRVDISPPDVLPDAKWRRLGESEWRDSGTTEAGVAVGPHIVEFSPVTGWLTPAGREVVVAQDTPHTLAAEYTDLGDLTLRINEFMAGNSSVTGIKDEHGDSDDWIEIYNATDFDVDMGGMYIGDSDEPDPWRIPTGYPAQTTVRAKGYIVFWADDEEETEGPVHLAFKLGVGGDTITLYDTDGVTPIDSVTFGSQIWNVSYGRYPDASNDWYFFDDPSEGAENEHAGVANRVEDTTFYPDRGFYDAPFEVTIDTNTPGATIYFTTDCSDPINSAGSPTGTAEVYDAASNKPYISTTTCLRAAAVKAGYLSTNIDTHTYVFPDDVLNQPTLPDGYPSQWISGGNVATGDYQVDPDIVNHTVQSNRLTTDHLRSVPTICVVMNKDDWFQTGHGLYVTESLDGTEYPCSFEYFDPDGDGRSIQQNMAVAMAGGVSGGGTSLNRWKSYKLSIRPRFKTQTDNGTITGGGPKLRERIFPDSPVNDMDTIVLDAVLNNSWTHPGGGQQGNVMLIQDQYVADLHNAMGGYSPHGGHAHIYINGLYWGMYYIHERPDHSWAAETFGGEKDAYDAIKHNSGNVINNGIGGPGASSNYSAMRNAASSAGSDPTNLTKWETLEQHLDVDSFIDYLLANWYVGNSDWPHKNWYATHRVPDGKWRFHSWDAEHVIYTGNEVGESPNGIHGNLDNSAEYRIRFADRIHKHFHHGGALTYPRTAQMYKARMDSVDLAIRGESARWGDNRRSTPYTYQDWLRNQNSKLNSYFPGRSNKVFGWLKSAGLYPDTDPPDFEVNGSPMYGGYVSLGDGITVTNSNGDGTIYYTTNGNDPRLPGGAVNSAGGAITYIGPIPVAHTIHLKARVLDAGQWSALSEAVYAIATVAEKLRITEIMYHPQDPPASSDYSDRDFEYIELKHIGDPGDDAINLNMVSFTNGVEYTFDASVLLDPGDYLLVVKNQAAFAGRYDTTGLNLAPGQYVGSLDNGGEEIDLEDALGTEIHDFDYDDDWRSHTDGEGFSLTIIDPLNPDPNSWGEKDSWRASAYAGGSPGAGDSGILPNPGAIAINEVMAHSPAAAPDWIELYNTTDGEIEIGGWYLSDSSSDLKKYRIAEGERIGAHEYMVLYEDVNFGEFSSDTGRITGFALSENGEEVYLSSAQNGVLTGYRNVEDFGASATGVSFGRYYKPSTGNYNFVSMDSSTPGSANSYPKVGPIVINEIMYNPATDNQNEEYIELHNISSSAVTLYDSDEGLPWKFTDGVDYTFPEYPGLKIPAGGYVLIVPDVAAYTNKYGLPPFGVTVLGPYIGGLSNAGEKLELSMPGDEDEYGTRYYIRVDRVNYSDGSHHTDAPGGVDLWPVEADGGGKSLTRKVSTDYGNDPANWIASTPSAGE